MKRTLLVLAMIVSTSGAAAEPGPLRNAYFGEMYSTIFPDAPGYQREMLEAFQTLGSLKDKQEWFYKYVVSNTRGENPQHPPFDKGPGTTKDSPSWFGT